MLDTETKRKIDSCRDILVGKIPDPKSQVEQITIALIYKFMDDMDQWSVEQGGKASFFRGEFEKYSWSSIFDPRISGFELFNLYGEALTKMNHNPNIPQLFRDIFKNAYLPYRDPETLRMFLKEIRGFSYDHSEKLGDAFEYLLSVLSSQGDAGQFRTPRHIIDFMVKVVDPQLNETVLDPACGTAGFLISAYKNITANNQKLNPDQKKRLLNNFVGYDISPDMVRLSLVNMYLHGFKEPHIVEYDTLTSEERWQDTFDVIMANPPFMTPKGGIRPHSRFSIQAKRSEVLFVDYIAEHLNPSGRAGVIVPEGIIFQSQNAYKALRKMLVENCLWAVVSLPAGIFNPYSGVKTSILFMDKSLAKRVDRILFVKVENDGFDLGAQRRVIDKNDLTAALKFLNIYKSKIANLSNLKSDLSNLNSEISNPKSALSPLAHAVLKSEIAKSGDYTLSGDRYRTLEQQRAATYPKVYFADVLEINPDKVDPQAAFGENEFIYVDITSVENGTGRIDFTNRLKSIEAPSRARRGVKKNDILLSTVRPNLKAFAYLDECPPDIVVSTGFAVLRAKANVLPKYVYHLLFSDAVQNQMLNRMGKGSYPSINQNDVENLEIPLPPLEIQGKIVAEINGYQKIIDGARQIVENYKPSIKINPAWPMVKIGEICNLVRGSSPRPKSDKRFYGGSVPRLMVSDLTRDGMYVDPKTDFLTKEGAKLSRPMKKGNVVMAVSGNPGLPAILKIDACIHDGFVGFKDLSKKLIPEFFYFVLLHLKDANNSQSVGAVFLNLTTDQIKEFAIPVPAIDEQKQIVAEIESEQKIVNDNKKLIEIFEKKISDTISSLWS